MAAGGLIGGIIGGLIDPTSYIGASQRSSQVAEQATQGAWGRRMGEQRFNIEKMLAMQQYRTQMERNKWKRDFARALGGLA